MFECLPTMIGDLASQSAPGPRGLLLCVRLPLDIDAFAMENSGTAK